MRKMFIKYLIVVIACAMVLIIIFNNLLTNRIVEEYALREAKDSVSQTLERMESNEQEMDEIIARLKEDYLTRCRSLKYMAMLDETILEDSARLKEIMSMLNVDEVHVIGRDGLISASSVDEYVGYDMASAEQSAEFLELFDDPSAEMVQDIMPNGAEGREFQYAGMCMPDGEHLVQVGMKPERYLKSLRKNDLSNFISGMADNNKSFFIINKETGRYEDHSDESMIGGIASGNGDFTDMSDFYNRYSSGGFYDYINESYYLYVQEYNGKIVGVSYNNESIMDIMSQTKSRTILYVSLTFAIVFVLIIALVDNRIVKRIHNIISDLDEIAGGNLEKSVNENSLPEFEKLSSGINHMKNSVISNSSKISGIIDAMNVPIAVYEINYIAGDCTVTGNIRKLFRLTEEENESILSDKENLKSFIAEIMSCPEEGEENVYRLNDKKCWVKIDEIPSDNEMFCVITDATDFILEKHRIVSERDRDALTGIYNRRCFERKVSVLMEKRHTGVSAMLMIDLDNFKGVNDSYGHAFGDEYLKFTADCLKTFAAENVIVGRRSGDEFYMYFSDFKSHWAIKAKIEELYKLIRETFITTPDGREITVPFSAGAAFLSDRVSEYNDLLNEADEMLYKAKNENKGGFFAG